MIQWLIIAAIIFIASWCFYKLFAYLLFLGLKKKLHAANLEVFKDFLGERYQCKMLVNGSKKYKWFKGWMTIRGNFSEAGDLINKKISASFHFFKWNNEVNFL